MKQKNPDTLENSKKKNPPDTPSAIDIEEIDSEDNQPEAANGSSKRSWVWNHLKEADEDGYVVCQVIVKTGKICGRKLKKDKSSSTKTFHGHLLQQHQLVDPSLSKKTQMKHLDMKRWCDKGIVRPQVS